MFLLLHMSSDLRIRLNRETLTPKWCSSKPVRWSRRKRASGELMMGYICVVKSRGSLQGKDTKKKVLEATGAADVEKNESGELELHGRTYSAWSTAIPGAPLKSGG